MTNEEMLDTLNTTYTNALASGDSSTAALYRAVLGLLAVNTPVSPLTTTPPKAGAKWSASDDKWLLAAYQSGEDVTTLSRMFNRSIGSIHSRIAKLTGVVYTPTLPKT